MYLEIFLADFTVYHVLLGISRDFAEKPEFRGSASEALTILLSMQNLSLTTCRILIGIIFANILMAINHSSGSTNASTRQLTNTPL